jgi:subtilisin family serine protease
MATVIGKKQLLSTDLKYFKDIQGIEKRTLFERYSYAEPSIINKYVETQYQSFLTHPVQDGNSIKFYCKNYNETPQLLSELQGDDLTKYTIIKDKTLAHYNSIIHTLRDSGKNEETKFLEYAIKYVDKRFIYCYDEIVVLGVWGMQLRDNIRADISEICKNLAVKTKKEPEILPLSPFTITFNAGSNGNLNGNDFVNKQPNELLSDGDIPEVEPVEGYEFDCWDENPDGYEVTANKKFTAQYKPKSVAPPVVPLVETPVETPVEVLLWYIRFWNWLKTLFAGKGCLKWLLWLLLLLLLLLLFGWLFRNCSGHHLTGGAALSDNDSTWVKKDPRVGDGGGIYNPHDPYSPEPTPPAYEDILPPQQGVLPPIEDNPEIIPGNPAIIGNRLNILMENEDKSIMDFAKDFKAKYPDAKYKVVYYDNVVKRMQIEIPSQDREQLKQEIPSKFAPVYKLFVFDEALLEGAYTPNDPAFKDNNKNWYLRKINAPKAWDLTRGSDKITIAIVDNGFNLKHPELRSKVVQPYNVWKHSDDIFPQQIDHGTHVAGTALAIANNEQGLCGIAPNCKFMPIQVANEKGMMTTTSVLDGILYALYQGADVINVSLGGQFSGLSQIPESKQRDLIQNHFKEEERLWREIMRIAASHNATLVVAAGNDNVLAGIEALQRPELFITVSAVDKNSQSINKAKFSNYGAYSKISAPGVGIYSSVGSNSYQTMDGTSMAAPIVSGAVALMKSIKSTLTTKQIICILQNTGLPTQGKIGKLLQLDKALQMVRSGNVIDCTPKPSTGDVQILLNWNNYNDLDLYCTDPKGEAVWFKNKSISSGGQLEIDMNVEYPDSKKPIENIFWPNNGAPNGTYNVYLRYYKKQEPNINKTPYTITVKYGGKTENYKGNITKEDKTLHICSFTVGNGSTIQNPSNRPNAPAGSERRNSLLKKRESLQQELDRIDRELKTIGNNS